MLLKQIVVFFLVITLASSKPLNDAKTDKVNQLPNFNRIISRNISDDETSAPTIKPYQLETYGENANLSIKSERHTRGSCQIPYCLGVPLFDYNINVNLVKRRPDVLPVNTVVVMDNDGYRMPFPGLISIWRYYCNTSGSLHLSVFRKIGTKYNLVGLNTVTCAADSKQTAEIPFKRQILVKQNDVVGAFSTDANTLSVTSCNSGQGEVMILPVAKDVAGVNSLARANFSSTACYVLSLGFTLVSDRESW
ncbi:uncharacterized protein LOC131954641 [Physella acuta]|uniref:uncharacterized protein LOC131954641 n=1 Tax=Physella acuta TaxID=109671 RepID=UPI0027DDFBFA|nr:uncharacterized protein LOC131954641 [Physella acuta]